MTTTHIVTHGGCPDGFTSAWLLDRAFASSNMPAPIEHHFASYTDEPISIEEGDEVIIADFSYDRETIESLAQKACLVSVYDHHKSAQEALEGVGGPNLVVEFDMSRSGAKIVYDNLLQLYDINFAGQLVDYVQDYDLWTKALPETESINAVIQSTPFTFEAWDDLATELQTNLANVVKMGKAIDRYRSKMIDTVVQDARPMMIGGHSILVVGCPYAIGSMVAGKLALENDIAFGAYYVDKPHGRQFGLRSRSNDGSPGFDVSEVAKIYGGGGHRNAAGFTVPLGHVLQRI